MITASQRHPFAAVTSSRAFSLGARYTCERYGDDDETSGDEDSMASTFVRSLPEEDDGWESGEDLNASSKLMAFVDDASLVDEVKALYATTQEKESLRKALSPLLKGMFADHTDPYSLLVSFLKRGGRVLCSATLALPRVALAEFMKWLEEQNGLKETQRPLSQEHRVLALDAFTYCPPCIFNDLCSTFDLASTDRSNLIYFVQTLQDLGKYKEVAVATKKFGLHGDISLQTIVIPLIAQDMVNVIEDYLSDNRDHQLEFLRLLDALCLPGALTVALKQHVGVADMKDTSKLNVPQLYKLGIRMHRLYSIELKSLPNLMHMKCVKLLKQLLYMKYIEDSILDDNFEEMVEVAVGDNAKLQQELIFELVQHKAIKMAAHFAVLYKVPTEKQPCEVDAHIALHGRRSIRKLTAGSRPQGSFLDLSLSLTQVVFVDSFESLQCARRALIKDGATVGIDGEWSLVSPCDRLALLQLAVQNSVFLLDMLNLPKVISQYELKSFFVSIFGNCKMLKLGYQIDADLSMLARSCRYLADVLACPKRVVDLKVLAANLQTCHYAEELPEHPVLKSFLQSTSKGRDHSTSGCLSNGGSDGDTLEVQGVLGNGDGRCSEARSGLSALVHKYTGRPLDKSQQISNWERRPLKPDQVKYAALDAFCLLGLYEALRAEALAMDPLFNVEPSLPQPTTI
ncbi:hypothetical protein EMCRGX_G021006 [Ephydatia muelleri]